MKSQRVVLLALCALSLLAGCGGGSISQPPLAITSLAPPSGITGSTYAGAGFLLTASGGVASYRWSWSPAAGSALPPGLTLSNAMISGTPTTAGTYNVVITVADSHSPAAQKSSTYPIKVAAGALVITSGAPPAGTLGAAYASGGFPLTASGGSEPYNWSWAPAAGSALPPGLTLSKATISGTPTTAGTYNVVITVADSQNPSVQTPANYTIMVYDQQLTITSTPPGGTALAPYGSLHFIYVGGIRRYYTAFSLSASGGSGSYAFRSSTLPPGLGCCSHTFGGIPNRFLVRNIIWGRPTTPGAYQVSLTVTDSQTMAQATKQFTIVIHNPPPPAVNDALLPIGTMNSPYVGFKFTATDGLPPLVWDENGALPTGMGFAHDGSLSGTPTVADSFPITVTASDPS